MQSEIFRAICQMGIFMICAQSILHFRPKASYEKYLKMLVSVMILIQLFLPVGQLVFGSTAGEFAGRVAEFEQSLDMSMQRAEESAMMSQEKLEEMTLREVQRLLPGENGADGAEENKGTQDTDMKYGVRIEIDPVEPVEIEAGEAGCGE